MTDILPPLDWLANPRARTLAASPAVADLFPAGIAGQARGFHRQIPGFRMSPLKGLNQLASRIGLGGIWVKDESARLDLRSFKILGGSFAIYRLIQRKLGMEGTELSYEQLVSPETQARLNGLTFAAATDGNHGRGVAWAARQLGCRSIIYVHKDTSAARIDAIRMNGAVVKIVDGTYDDAVRQVTADARQNGWEIVADTSWEGYESVPTWVM